MNLRAAASFSQMNCSWLLPGSPRPMCSSATITDSRPEHSVPTVITECNGLKRTEVHDSATAFNLAPGPCPLPASDKASEVRAFASLDIEAAGRAFFTFNLERLDLLSLVKAPAAAAAAAG